MHLSRRALLGAGAAGLALLSGWATASSAAAQSSESGVSAQMHAVLDRTVAAMLRESPERCTSLGLTEERAGYRFIDKLSDASKQGNRRYRAIIENALTELRAIDRAALPARDQVTLDVVTTSFENSLGNSRFEVGSGAGAPYVVTQLTGAYHGVPDFLDNQHPLRSADDADAYLARLNEFARQLDQETAIIPEDAAAGVIPPDFAIDRALEQLNAFASRTPADTVLVQTLVRRLPDVQEISASAHDAYISHAESIVRDAVLPAYQRQIEALRAVRPQAVHDAGVWRLPQGAEMYAASLRSRTTTAMTPDEIHDIGVELIRQFHAEMDAILRGQGMTRGSIAERVQALSERPDQLYPNTDEGRAQILADLNAQTREIVALMPRAFNTLAR